VERDQTGPLTDGIEQDAEIAKPRQDLGIVADEVEIQIGKELHAAVSAPLGKDDFHLFIQKGGVDLRNFFTGRRQFGYRSLIDDFEPQLLQVLYAGREFSLPFDQVARRNCVYGLQPNLHWGKPR